MQIKKQKILFIRLGAIGDVIRTLPALNAFRTASKDCYIAWVVEEQSESILKGHPQIDEVILFKRIKWQNGLIKPATFFKTLNEIFFFLKELKGKKFDIVLDFHGILKSGIIGFLTGAKKRFGFTRRFSKELNFLFNNNRVALPDHRINRVEKNMFLVDMLSKGLKLGINRSRAVFPVFDEDKKKIDIFFKNSININHKPFLALHPGSSIKTGYKRWSTEKYAKLADRIIKQYNASIILTWGPDEHETVLKIAGSMEQKPVIACRTQNLRQLAELIKRCSMYIGGDTAPMHIASLSGLPVIAIFGPTDPVINAPYGNKMNIIIRKNLVCSPCRNRKCNSVECMKQISVDEVYQAVERLLPLC